MTQTVSQVGSCAGLRACISQQVRMEGGPSFLCATEYRAVGELSNLGRAAAQNLTIGRNNSSTHNLSQHVASFSCRVGGGCRLHSYRLDRTLWQRRRKRAGGARENMSGSTLSFTQATAHPQERMDGKQGAHHFERTHPHLRRKAATCCRCHTRMSACACGPVT